MKNILLNNDKTSITNCNNYTAIINAINSIPLHNFGTNYVDKIYFSMNRDGGGFYIGLNYSDKIAMMKFDKSEGKFIKINMTTGEEEVIHTFYT